MLKVIELQIEDALSGDTGVWEVAWVEYPAIEEELMYFGRQKFYRAPVNVSKIACQAIKENEKRDNKAATQVGKIRAQQLCKRETISLETINRMKSYLERAKVYNTDDWHHRRDCVANHHDFGGWLAVGRVPLDLVCVRRFPDPHWREDVVGRWPRAKLG